MTYAIHNTLVYAMPKKTEQAEKFFQQCYATERPGIVL